MLCGVRDPQGTTSDGPAQRRGNLRKSGALRIDVGSAPPKKRKLSSASDRDPPEVVAPVAGAATLGLDPSPLLAPLSGNQLDGALENEKTLLADLLRQAVLPWSDDGGQQVRPIKLAPPFRRARVPVVTHRHRFASACGKGCPRACKTGTASTGG